MKRPSKKWPVLAPLRLFTTQLVYFLERNKSQNKDDNLKHVKMKYHSHKKTYLWPILCCVNIQTYKLTKLQKTRNLQNTWSEWTLLLPSLPTTFCLVFLICIHLGCHHLTTLSFLPPCCAFFLWDKISFGVWKAFHWKVKPVMEGCRPGPAKTF